MDLDDCTRKQASLLVAYLVLDSLFPHNVVPQDLVRYTRALGELKRKYFNRGKRKQYYNRPTVPQPRTIRARKPWA